MIDQQELKELLNYNPITGFFTWRERSDDKRWNTRYAGKQAGGIKLNGYCDIRIWKKHYYAHRLAYLYMTGEWPEYEIDHIEGDRADNRWHMLRPATRKEQLRNAGIRTDNTSGTQGVSWHKQRCKWTSRIRVGNKYLSLGLFTDKKEAIAVREAANEKYGFHPNHGKRTGYRS